MRVSGAIINITNDVQNLIAKSSIAQAEFASVHEKSIINQNDKKKKLGQVFTDPLLAQFMISLIKDKLKDKHRVLDPCIGPNTFLSLLDTIGKDVKLTGIEIDKSLITNETRSFYNKPGRKLIEGSFLEHPLTEKYDLIIQNPPYVRQELIDSKEQASQNIDGHISALIPSQSNLYVYFLIKSILHLKKNGVMVAVIYDSWLYNSFGKSLKDIFNMLGTTEAIYHFKKNAFSDADVGATVIYFKKSCPPKHEVSFIKYYPLDFLSDIKQQSKLEKIEPERIVSNNFSDYNFNEASIIDFNHRFFTRLKNVSTQAIQRGTSSVANGYFLHNSKLLKESIPLLKDVSKIDTYSASVETSYLLSLNGHISKETLAYLDTVKSAIINAGDKYKAVKDKIIKGEKWYKVNLKKPGNFIFNYYLRNNIDFILNEKQLNVSDNFYILNIEENPLAYLAILNSSFSRIAVLAHSRNQGNGLRKVQLYEFNNIPVININVLSSGAVKKLVKIGIKMKTSGRYESTLKNSLIREIDTVLLTEYNRSTNTNISLAELEAEQIKYFN